MWESAHSRGGDGKTASAGGMAWLRGVIQPCLVPTTCLYCCTAHYELDWWSFRVVAGSWRLVLPQHLPPRWQLSQWFMGTYFVLQLGWARSTYPIGYPSSQAPGRRAAVAGRPHRQSRGVIHPPVQGHVPGPSLHAVWRGHHRAEIPAQGGQAARRWRVRFPAAVGGAAYQWKMWPSFSSQ